MVGLGILEILCLLVFGMMFCGVVAAVVIFAIRSNSAPASAAPAAATVTPAAVPAPQPMQVDHSSHVEIVARLTQRFCPQCRSPLAADSPEGLCPACLMAGAMGGEIAPEPANGMAATTPPSGSQPPLNGAALAEISELQQHFPQLEILELLGRGGMGAVYKARQKNLDRIVALKVIPPDAAKDPTFAERFNREARALARLNHPSIVTVYDFDRTGDMYWLLMEYVDGVNLRQTLRAGRLAPREAVAIVPPICDALQYAHDQGVVHRDIKPENVLLDRTGRVKIADFGLAKLLGKGPDDFTLTRTQQIMGTPRYMAPEQIERPSTVDHRADIYSLGVVIYEMLTGELPIGRFEPPSHKVQMDVRIDEVVLRSLEKNPDRRYQRASEVKTELASATSWPTLAAIAGPGGAVAAQAPRQSEPPMPTWHTPAPAVKAGDLALQPPGGVPLAHVLMVAFGMVLGVLLMAGGLATLIYALYYSLKGASNGAAVGGMFGAGFGCLVGGAGSVAGSYNTYRQLAGAEDLMRSRRTTWLDWIMWGYLVLGILILLPGLVEAFGNRGREDHMLPLLLLGGIATAQALLFLVFRTLYCLGAKPDVVRPAAVPRNPGRERMRRRVAGPAIGLIIVGVVGLFPCAAMVLALPLLVIVPSSVQQQRVEESFELPTGDRAVPGGAVLLPAEVSIRPPVLLAQRVVMDQPMADMPPGPMWGMVASAGMMLFSLPLSLLMIIGGWRMRNMQSYGLAVIAAIAALLPCTFGWLLGLPIGLWALITLLNGDVREAFDQDPNEPDSLSEKPPQPARRDVPVAATSNAGSKIGIVVVVFVVLFVGVGMLVPLLLPAVQSTRSAARRAQSQNNLKQIGLALHNYHELYGAFPPAVVTDASGKPLYSGRVLLLPFLEQGPLYQSFTLSKPWDSVENFALSRVELPVFKDPLREDFRPTTDYLFLTGTGTLFEAGKKVTTADCTDGLTNTVVMAEVKGSNINWAEPRDLSVSQPVALPAGHHSGGNLALFADGSVQFMPKGTLAPSQLRARATIAGGKAMAIASDRSDSLLASLRRESFDTGKLSFIRSLSPRTGLTSEQARLLMKEFAFDKDRVEAAVHLHPLIIDPENFYVVLEAFTFDHDRQAVRKRLKLE